MVLETVRRWQFTQMELNLRTVDALLFQTDSAVLSTYRDGGTGWTVVEVLGHLNDFEAVFHHRATLTVEQDNPELPFPDPDELADQNNYIGQPWQSLLDNWKQTRDAHLQFLKSCTPDEWERPAQHPTRGKFTLHDQLFFNNLHDSIHLEQMTRILSEKQLSG